MLAADLLHAARALRAPDDRRQGPQAEGCPDRAARDARRRALHPLLALRALLRHHHADRRARDLQPRGPLRARGVPGDHARQPVLGERRGHLPRRRAHRPGLPVPGARLVPGSRQVDLPGLRAGLQHRGPHEPEADAPRPGPAGGAPQAPVQRRGEPVVDVRRGALRLRRPRFGHAARAPGARTGRRPGRGDVGRGRGPARRAPAGRGARGDRGAPLAGAAERGSLAGPAPVRRRARGPAARLPGAAAGAGVGRRLPAGRRQGAELPGGRPPGLRRRRPRRRLADPRRRPGGRRAAPLGGRPRRARQRVAGRPGRRGARPRRVPRLPGDEREPDQRPGALRAPERALRRARGHVHERRWPRPALLARRPAARRGPARLGDLRRGRAGARPRLAAPAGRAAVPRAGRGGPRLRGTLVRRARRPGRAGRRRGRGGGPVRRAAARAGR